MSRGFQPENFQEVSRIHINSVDDFIHPKTRKLYEWWTSFHPNVPCRQDFHIEENWSLAANLYLIESLGNGKYLYRLNGENVKKLVGQNQSGNIFSTQGETLELVALAKYLDGIREIKKPIRCEGTLAQFGRGYTNFESVDCPLCNEDGVVTHTIGLLIEL